MKFAALITACLRILLWRSVHAGIPPAAVLSLDPQHHVYIRDEKVILTCLAPDGLEVAGYTFFKEQQDQTLKELPNRGMGPYEILHVNEDTVGSYSCVYWIMPSRQEIFSPQSNLVFVSMADPPPFPVLKVDPPSGVVNEGGSLRLTCLSNGTITEKRFHFFKDGAEMATVHEGSRQPANNSPNASVSILQAKVNHSGEFACGYEEAVGGRWVMSQWSKPGKVVVNVPVCLQILLGRSVHADLLRPPFFSVSPKPYTYISGEFVSLTCSAPENLHMWRVLFRRDQSLVHDYRPPSPLASFTYTRRFVPQDSGDHFCTYRAVELSQNISSPGSRRIRILVMAPVDLPPAPVLTVDPLSGVVNAGGILRLTCSAIGSDAEQRFHFYKDRVKISSSSEESLTDSGEPRNAFSNASANLLVPVTASIHAGGFACRYEQKLSNQWIISPWSQTVNVTAQLPNSPAPSVRHAWWASLLLMPVALFAYCCWRKKGLLFALDTSKYQLASEPKESKEESSQYMLGLSVPQMTDLRVKSSDVTYASIASPSAVTPSEPTLKGDPISAKDKEVLYSDLLFRSQQ